MKSAAPAVSWVAIIMPSLILLKFLSVALYASPETDDFCFFYHYQADGLLSTVALNYNTAIGRIVPIVLMTLPEMASQATGLDMFIVYPLFLIGSAIGFVLATIAAAGRLWPTASSSLKILAGVAFAATIFAEAISTREMLYWVPGISCYMVPAAIVMIVFVVLFRSAADLTALSGATLIATLCFLGALCNEFTPIWILGLIASSFLFRRLTLHPYPQSGFHALLLFATLAGFAILLAAPANAVRFAQFPQGGKFFESINMGIYYAFSEWQARLTEPSVLGWLGFVAVFSVFVAPAEVKAPRSAPALLLGIAALTIGCTLVGCFVGYYATGEDLVTRGRNEMIVLMFTGLTCFVSLGVRLIGLGTVVDVRSPRVVLVATIACGLLCFPIIYGRSVIQIDAERSQFERFWLESMSRNALLRLAPDANMVVPDRTVKPTILMSADLTDNPHKLPNDCVASFYAKATVIMHPVASSSIQKITNN